MSPHAHAKSSTQDERFAREDQHMLYLTQKRPFISKQKATVVRSLLKLSRDQQHVYMVVQGSDDDRAPFWASQGYQAFGSMVLCLLGSACATWLSWGVDGLEARIKTAFVTLRTDVVIALAAMNCAMWPLVIRPLEDVGHAMADLFGGNYRGSTATLYEDSVTFQAMQKVLQGNMGEILPYNKETLRNDLMCGLNLARRVALDLLMRA